MVFSQSTIVRPSNTSSISGYEKFQKGIFDVSELKSKFYMNSPEKISTAKSDTSTPNYNKNGSSEHSIEIETSGVNKEHKSPSSTSTSVENSSPKSIPNPLQNLLPRFIFSNEESADFSPVSSFPEFCAPTGEI